MVTLDEAIEKGRRKRRLLAVSFSVSLITLLVLYFGWLFLTKGYSFSVKPEAAAQTQRFAVQSGIGFFIDDTYYVLGSDSDVAVSADKYQTKEVRINSASPSTIEVELLPKPAQVTLTTTPAGKENVWFVNGEQWQLGEVFDQNLAPGRYTVSVSNPAYEPASLDIEALIDGRIDQTIPLTPISGTITIDSSPAGAEVTINGDAIGVTPVATTRTGGEYAVVVNKPGYEPLKDTVRLTRRQKAPSRDYKLQPLQATVQVSMAPSGGALIVDGKPATSPVSVDANKQHEFRYEKAGYIKQSQTLTLKPGAEKRLRFELAPEMGTVSFTATLASEVYVNGKSLGSTPLKTTLQTVPAKVEFRKAGYRTVKQTVEPSVQRVSHVKAEMLREFDARRKEGKPLFVSSLGIEMARISPKAYTMGSPVNEAGRGRNEHRVNVDFSRSVWVSRHEITEAQFAAFKGTGSKTQMPVTQVSWVDAALFSNWLSHKEGLTPFYNVQNGQVTGVNTGSRGYRLPTEAEWEYLAKMNRRANPTVYVWGSQERMRDKQGNFADESVKDQQTFFLRGYNDGFAGKAPVGSFKAERGGFYDLDGNVREWVHDRYTLAPPNKNRVHTDYLGADRGNERVVKGASFKTGRLKNLRVSLREGVSEPADDIGFRIARYHD